MIKIEFYVRVETINAETTSCGTYYHHGPFTSYDKAEKWIVDNGKKEGNKTFPKVYFIEKAYKVV
jgi:hypothetical protein